MYHTHTQDRPQRGTHWRLWLVCLFGMVLAGFVLAIREPMWIKYAGEQGWQGKQVLEVQSYSAWVSAVGVLMWATLADVWGRKRTLLLAWAGLALALGGMWLLPSHFELLKWTHLLSALALTGIPVVSVVWCWENSQRLRYGLSGCLLSGFALGMFATHALDYADVAEITGIHGLLMVGVGCVLVIGALVMVVPQALPDHTDAALSQMQYAAGQLPRHDWAAWFKNLLVYGAILGLSLAVSQGLQDYVRSVVMNMDSNTDSMAHVNQVLAIMTTGGLALGLFVSGWVMQFLGRLTALWGLCILALGCKAYMTWQPSMFQDFNGAWILMGAYLGLGSLMWWSTALVAASVAHLHCTAWALVSVGGVMMAASIHHQLPDLAQSERFAFEYYVAMMVLIAVLIALVRKPQVLD